MKSDYYNRQQLNRETLDTYLDTQRQAERVYNILTSRKYSRGAPINKEAIIETIAEIDLEVAYKYSTDERYQETSERPFEIKLSGLWGGSKESETGLADEADVAALDNLAALEKEINSIGGPRYIGRFETELIFCDAHHFIANRMTKDAVEDYYGGIKQLAEEREISLKRLFDFYWCDLGLATFPFRYAGLEARTKARELISTNPEFTSRIEDGTKKHSLWVQEGISPKEIAKLYVQMEIDFLMRLNEEYPRRIFFSYSNPEIQRPIAEAADVSMLYFHSFSKGHNECPWYIQG